MKRPRWALACLLGAAVPRPAAAQSEDVARFAIVIGNNRPERLQSSALRYADDDAVATHRLLVEAGVRSTLLVRLDDDSRGLYPDLGEHGLPQSSALENAFTQTFAEISATEARGRRADLLVFYSGHGDVDRGEGYVTLEDGRLTRTKLYSLLARSPATQNHVFVDACKSYYLAFDKGPGGHREPYAQPFVDAGIPAELTNTGFVLSTSSARDSHEWERFQAGILSHELRSALRGAADVNGDGRVTYAELGAFLVAANQSIPNPRFRPDFMVRPPGGDLGREALRWTGAPPALYWRGAAIEHFYVETVSGLRVLDAHPAKQQELALHVPAERPLFVRLNDETAEYVVVSSGPVRVETLVAVTPEIGRRGALNLAFEKLFAAPFGNANVQAFIQQSDALPRSDDSPRALPQTRRIVGTVSGSIAIGAAATGLTLSLISAQRYWGGAGASQVEVDRRNRQVQNLNLASVVFYAVAGAAGLTWGWTKLWPEPELSISSVASDQREWRGAMLNFNSRF